MARSRAFRWLGLLLFLLIPPICLAQSGPQVLYIYDELGRLVGVVDPNGDSAAYAYDAAGNLLSITRKTASQVSIIEVTPDTGPVGTAVTIYGSGFSATPSQNTVKFNGTTATVTASTANRIDTVVPAGATTGTIQVIAPLGSVTSATPFTVGSNNAPTITGFTPGSGLAGVSVTINGTNFSTQPASNRVLVNATRGWVMTATATSLTAIIPAAASSGRFTVTTPLGQAVSAADFIIPPTGFTTTDVGFSGRVPLGSPITVTIPAANKIGLVLFDGIAGNRVSVPWSGNTIPGTTYFNIIKPDGSELTNPIGNGANLIDAQTLPATGTYTVLVDPFGTGTGSVTVTPYDLPPDFSSPIVPGGAPVVATMTVPAQNARLTFAGTAGQRIAVGMGNSTIPGTTYVSIQKPDGSTLFGPVGASATFIDTQTLPVTGTYTILVDPYQTGTGSLTVTLYDVPADFTSPITPGGAAVTANITAAGQNARLTFAATAAQRFSFTLTNSTIPGTTYVSVQNPDGSNLIFPFGSSAGFADTFSAPTTGTYTILIDPSTTSTGNLTVTLYDVGADPTASIVAGGPAVTITTTVPGQNGRLTFSGTAGQRVSLGWSNSTIPGTTGISILNPNGSTLAGPISTFGSFMDVVVLTATGTHTILVDPYGTGTGSLTMNLYDVPADFTGTIVAGGSAVTTTTTVPGQNARLTFNGTAGQRVSMTWTNNTIPGVTSLSILNPNGSTLAGPTSTFGGFLDVVVLTTTGTHTVLVDPTSSGFGSLTLTLYDVPPDVTGPIDPGGSPVTPAVTVPGQDIRLTFNGTAGQKVSLGIANVTFPGVTTVSYLNPDGSTLLNPTSTFNGYIDAMTLPATGAYTLVVNPTGSGTGSLTLTLYNVVDVTGSVTPNGATVYVELTTLGQNAALTFSGTQGQQVTVHIVSNDIGLTTVKLLKPDATVMTTTTSSSSSFNLATQTLPTTGTYTITVDPNGSRTGLLGVSVTVP